MANVIVEWSTNSNHQTCARNA